jgi:hypothetical protein
MLITAEQARQRAKTYISVYEQSQFEQIMENINKESDRGYFKYYGDGELRPAVKKKLEELGYRVMTKYISWK